MRCFGTLMLASCTSARPTSLADLFTVGIPIGVSTQLLVALQGRPEDGSAQASSQLPVTALRLGQQAPPGRDTPVSFVTTTASGSALAKATAPLSPHELDPPYWSSLFRRVAAAGGGRTYVALNLLYLIRVYDLAGTLVDSITVPPPSWRQARVPVPGEFLDRDPEWFAYLRGVSVIDAMAVLHDTVLVVSHGRFIAESRLDYSTRSSTLTIYAAGRRIAVDLPSPGQLVAYSATSLFFLSNGDEEGGRVLTEYLWRPATF